MRCAELIADGERLYAEGDLGAAETALRRALEAAPDDLEARHDLAVVLCAAGCPAEALAHAAAVIALDPAFPGALTTLGGCELSLGLPQSSDTLARAVIREPSAGAWELLAGARRAAGDIDGAAAALAQAAALSADAGERAQAQPAPIAVLVVTGPGGAAALEPTLASLARQTAPAAEVRVIDDATGELVSSAAGRIARSHGLRVATVTHERAVGGAGARASGLAATSAPLVLALEAGDVLVPDALAILSAALEESPGAALAYALIEVSDGAHPLPSPPPWTPDGLLGAAQRQTLSLIRRDALATLGGYRADAVGLADLEVLARACAAGLAGVMVPRYLVREPAPLAAARGAAAQADQALERLVVAMPAAFSAERLASATAALERAGQRRVAGWFAVAGDLTHRLDYALDSGSVVLDAGGYEGQWTADIVGRYGCAVHCFEPVPRFAEQIAARFAAEPRVHVHAVGVAARSRRETIHLAADGTSVFGDGEHVPIELKGIGEIFDEFAISEVHLFKINIEGVEYELCEELLSSGLIARVRDLQVQFHDFVPEARRRREQIRRGLARTHVLTYDFPFTWENWRRR